MEIYCPLHRRNEHLTGTEAEALIHGLYARWSDETGEEPDPAWDFTHLYSFCPEQMTRSLSDPEMYAEHIDAMREGRLAAARVAREITDG